MKIIPAILEGFNTLKDKTFKLTFHTNELSPELVSFLAGNLQQFGFLAFKKDEFHRDEVELIENLKADFEDTGKTPSRRLRGVLYRSWEQNNERYDVFNDYYQSKMEKIINHFKKDLD